MPTFGFLVTPECANKTLRQVAMSRLGLSGAQFKRAKFHGLMLLDGQPVHADARLMPGQRLTLIIPEPESAPPVPVALPLNIPFEDEHFLMIDKPAPLPSSSSCRQDAPTLQNILYAYLGCPEGFVYRPVNRLDKGTSGLMLAAKTAYAQNLMQRALHSDDFIREYLAVTEGAPPATEGVIDLPIAKDEGATIRRVVRTGGKPARTSYRLLYTHGGRSLIRLRLDTGRTHQIRVHLQALGCPVCGDFLYGAECPELPGRFALHSTFCRVRHPITGEWLERESPLPAELERLLQP